jgi:thiol:disulfide interchange protein DsbC
VSLIQPDQSWSRGRAAKVVYVFSDPACGHCQKLEQTLAGMPTLRVRTILLPLQPGSRRPGQGSSGARRIASAAWSAWMLNGVPDPAPEACQADVLDAEPGHWPSSFGIRATPALVAPDGRVSLGALEAPALSAWLNPDQTAVTTVATEVSP